MKESGYYPAGAEHDPSAPWNQGRKSKPKLKEKISYLQALVKENCEVETDDYVIHKEYDETGSITEVDTSETDWNEAYLNCHYTPMFLICYLKNLLSNLKENGSIAWTEGYDKIIKECDGWKEEYSEVQ